MNNTMKRGMAWAGLAAVALLGSGGNGGRGGTALAAAPVAGSWSETAFGGIREAEYHFAWLEGALSAPNRSQGLRTILDESRLVVTSREGGPAAFALRLELAAVRRGGALLEIQPARLHANAREAWSDRGDLIQTVRNEDDGLRLRFELRRLPGRPGDPVAIELSLDRTLLAYPDGAGARSVLFRTPAGEPALRLSGLEARDHAGRPIDATIRFDAGALYVETAAVAAGPITIDLVITPAGTTFDGDQLNADFGWSVATAGDLNDDGYSDIVVGAPRYDAGQQDEGKVFVYLGGPGGPSTTPAWTSESNEAGAEYGLSVAPAGDVNGDGFFDLLVGCPDCGVGDPGAAFLYAGSASGVGAQVWTASLGAGTESFGFSVATAGDVNGDTFADIVVGAPTNDAGGSARGSVAVYHGAATWPATTADRLINGTVDNLSCGSSVATAGNVNGDLYADIVYGCPGNILLVLVGQARIHHGSATGVGAGANRTLSGDAAGRDLFGWSVSTAGDVDADGYSDIIVGAPLFGPGSFPFQGRVQAFYGTSAGIGTTADFTFTFSSADDQLGAVVASAGDVNGDGFGDVVVGANRFGSGVGNEFEGRVVLFFGRATGLVNTATQSIESNVANSNFGASAATAGDVNGDGYSDLIVGAIDWPTAGADGRVSLFLGGADLPADAMEWQSEQADAELGFAVAAGDFNADGYSDVVVGAPLFDGGQNDEGRVFVYNGSAAGPPAAATLFLEANQATARFGAAVASGGDVNGDGFDDLLVGAESFDGGSTDEGRVFVFNGSATGVPAAATQFLEMNTASENFGHALASAGDVNGDGFADVIVGGPQTIVAGQRGRAHLYHGGAAGLPAAPTLTITGAAPMNSFGWSVASVGDLNADGFSDVIVGDPDYEANSRGNAFVYLGSAAGVSSTPFWSNGQVPSANADYGFSVAGIGDMNGDGLSDFAVGSPLAEFEATQPDEGFVHVYFGRPNGLTPGQHDVYQGNLSNGHLGWSVAGAGDVNNDGYSDVVMGAPTRGAGQMTLWYGSASGLATGTGASPTYSRTGFLPTDLFAAAVAPAGDVNGDGFADILAGSPHYGFDNGQANEGHAFVYYGGGRDGVDRYPRQRRFDDASALGLHGRSETTNSFKIKTFARSPMGRDGVRMDHEAADLSVPLDGSGITFGGWFDTGTVDALGSGINFTRSVTGLQGGPNFHWRFRFAHRSPFFPYSPWYSHPGNAVSEKDLRTSCTATTWYEDADGDGHGNAAVTAFFCTPPDGFVASSDDCDDTNALRYPGRVETCDGIDNDCDGTPDDGILAPTGLVSVTLTQTTFPFPGTNVDWAPVAGATDYDVVRGDLKTLSQSGGQFRQAIEACLANDTGATLYLDTQNPGVGNGFFYLIRPLNCGGVGSYDEGGRGQVAPRDAQIAASPNACP